MRIVMLTSGSRGDTQPLVVLGDELRRRGHDVVLGVSPNMVGFGQRAGLQALPVGPDSQAFLESDDGRRWLASGNVRAFAAGLGQVFHDNARALDTDTLHACEGADLIVAGSLGEHRAACVAEARGIPLVCLHYAPVRPTRAYPNMFVSTRRLPALANLATHALFQRVYWRGLSEDINAFRSQLGLQPATSPTARRLADTGTLELQAYDRALVPGLDDYPSRRPFVGFLWPEPELAARLGEGEVDADLRAWIDQGEPPVYFGFGSMPITEPDATLEIILAATEALGSRVLIGAGWGRLGASAPTDGRLRVVTGTLNFQQVLPLCAAAVHHGGSGTVAASVAAGVPTVVCSVVADNPFWGARVQELGIGGHLPYAALTGSALEVALRRAMHPNVVARAEAVGAQLRADMSGASRAADLVVAATG